MRLNVYVKVIILSAIMIVGINSPANAWPTFDCSVVTNFIGKINTVQSEIKAQIASSTTLSQISKTIGDAKSSISKFAGDAVEKAKKLAEKAKKEAQKLKQMKEKVDKAKKAYEEKKKAFAEYQEKINKAKNTVQSKINEAKSAVDDVKGQINDAKSAVQDKVNEAKSTVNNVKGQINDAKGLVSAGKAKVQNAVSKSNTVLNPTNVSTKPSRGASNSITPQTVITAPAPLNSAPVNKDMGAVNKIGRQAFTIAERPELSANSPQLESSPAPTEASSPDVAIEEGDDALSDGNKAVNEIKKVAKEKGATEASSLLTATVKKATKEKDIKTLDEVSKLNLSDVIVSDSKKYESDEVKGRTAFTRPTTELKVKGTAPSTNPVQVAPQVPVKQLSPSTAPAKQLAPATLSVPTKQLAPSLKTPQAKIQKNSFWLEGQSSNKISKLNYGETLKFANTTECTDYSYTIQNGDDGEIVVVSEEIAKYCCLQAKQLSDMTLIKDCLSKLALNMNGIKELKEDEEEQEADASIEEEAKQIYSIITAAETKNNAAEAMANLNTSLSYKKDVLEPYMEQIQKQQGSGETTERDNTSVISMTNEKMAHLVNLLTSIYATNLSNGSIEDLINISKESLDENTDIGLSGETGDYESSVTRGKGNYHVIPENMARKCGIKISEGTEKITECFNKIVSEQHASDFKEAEIAQRFIESIQTQELFGALGKALSQKVSTAEFDVKLQSLKDKNQDATEQRANNEAMSSLNAEVNKLWNDLINIYASQIAYDNIKSINRLKAPAPVKNKG